MCVWHLADEAASTLLAQRMAATRPSPARVYLSGPLGAGKSTIARAMIYALGVQGAIRSPTYTLVERYPISAQGEAWHLDLYRIKKADELECLGLDEECVELWLIEWPEHGEGMLPPADLRLHLEVEQFGRRLHLAASTANGREWLTRLKQDPLSHTAMGIAAG